MGCNCKVTESILALAIIVFAFWETSVSQWIIVIAAALILIHAFKCKGCAVDAGADMNAGAPVKKVKKVKKKKK